MKKNTAENRKIAVSVKNVSIKFNLGKEKITTMKDYFIKLVQGKLKYHEFNALTDISFELNKGDRLGILGMNGAGKSTLLKIIAQVYKPSSGSVDVNGVVAPLLELGAGFDPEYTGRENIFLYGAILGYSKKFIEEKYDEIVEFSELNDFIDVPLKNYSSGMRSRLGFAICTIVQPDILILDEVLSVGDAKFQKKCLDKIQSMFDTGVTVLFVSHSINTVKSICNKAMILEKGTMKSFGDINEVCEIYSKMIG